MATTTKPRSKARLEARIDAELDELIAAAAAITHGGNKSAFIAAALHDAALKVTARADVTLMDADLFERLASSLDEPDDAPALAALVAQSGEIAW